MMLRLEGPPFSNPRTMSSDIWNNTKSIDSSEAAIDSSLYFIRSSPGA